MRKNAKLSSGKPKLRVVDNGTKSEWKVSFWIGGYHSGAYEELYLLSYNEV
jgi:hypothetical protein